MTRTCLSAVNAVQSIETNCIDTVDAS